MPLLFYSMLPIEQVRRLDSFQEVILIVSKRYEDRIKQVRLGKQAWGTIHSADRSLCTSRQQPHTRPCPAAPGSTRQPCCAALQAVSDKFPELKCQYVHATHRTATAEVHSVAALLQACGRVSGDTSLFVMNACSATSPKVANNLLGHCLGWHALPHDSRHVRVPTGTLDPTFSALKEATEHDRNSQSPGRWSVCISKPCGSAQRQLEVFYSNEVEYEPASPVSRAGLAAFAANLRANTVKAMEASGVFFQDACSCWVAPTITVGMDSYIGPGVQIYGLTEVCSAVASLAIVHS